MSLLVNGKSLRIEDVINVARKGQRVKLSRNSLKQVQSCRKFLERSIDGGQTIYGVNTGFGHLSRVKIQKQDLKKLQFNLIRSHSVGVGEPYAREIIRAMMLLRLCTMARGYSGVRPILLRKFEDCLNKDIVPFIPESGSLGASGDLAPAAHLGLVIIGEGSVIVDRKKVVPGKTALRKAGIEPLHLEYKEGLSLINGTQLMSALGCFLVNDGRNFLKSLDLASALTVDVLRGNTDAFDSRVHLLRPHEKQIVTANNMRKILRNSRLVNTGNRVQDAYSIRCIPQIHGAYKQAWQFLKNIVEVEINSVTDNPIILANQGDIVSCGNFHGQVLSMAFDLLSVNISNASTVSERRIERMLNPSLSGLPPFLTDEAGLRSGLMMTQYTAAALTSETRILAHPASIDNIPVSAEQEDHSSMGVTAGNKAMKIMEKASYVVGIELICGCEAAEFVGSAKLGDGCKLTYDFVRRKVRSISSDRSLTQDITYLGKSVLKGDLVEFVEKGLGRLGC
jgi:histidine ammonia-lyase